MRIQNKTDFETKPLRRLIYEVARREGYDEPEYLKRLTVEVRSGRRSSWNPEGMDMRQPTKPRSSLRLMVVRDGSITRVYGRLMILTLPPEPKPENLAAVIAHEMAHNFGATHSQMPEDRLYCRPLVWAAEFALPRREVRQAAADPTIKMEHAQRMLKMARTRSKRAATILKKWERRVARYGRKGGL